MQDLWEGKEISVFSKVSRLPVCTADILPGGGGLVKGPRFEADHLCLYSAQVTSDCSYTSNPAICTHAVYIMHKLPVNLH